MRRWLPVLALLLVWPGSLRARGLLIPEDKTVPPLAMLNHQVTVTLEDQVAVTKVEQTFRNHTNRQLEVTYLFPVPKGASVNKFTMWVDGKEVEGELVEADKARAVYTGLVRRTQDPGLLEYLGSGLMRMRVFPVPAQGDQKVALSYTSVAPREAGVIEYVYPLKTDGKATSTLEKFSVEVTLKSQHAVQNVYSPTHAVTVRRQSDREVKVHFERDRALLDRDFQLLYTPGDKDVGLTALAHRPQGDADGYFLLLLSPRAELAKEQAIPRDFVFVLDTSGSMDGVKMGQARKALKYCLNQLADQDRFALMNFATTVTKYQDGLAEATQEEIGRAGRWVDGLRAAGGTAIHDALLAALALRPAEAGRPFTVVFFTDGQPTVGERNPEVILKDVLARNTADTRVFTFGVGDDVNAHLLDRLADQTRAASTYVRPQEDIEVKVSGLYAKISQPVLTNLKLSAGKGVRWDEVYPPRLPDLFQGGQLLVLGRYAGHGKTTVTLQGTAGKDVREYVYEVDFPEQTGEGRAFVEHLWARRKVGYLLDQVRAGGENKELVDETVQLAKRYGIATPYTSWLVVPDAPVPVTNPGQRGGAGGFQGGGGLYGSVYGQAGVYGGVYGSTGQLGLYGGQFGVGGQLGQLGTPLGQLGVLGQSGYSGGNLGLYGGTGAGQLGGLYGGTGAGRVGTGGGGKPPSVADFARKVQSKPGELAANRGKIEEERLRYAPGGAAEEARRKKEAYDKARDALARGQTGAVQAGPLGVDLAVQAGDLRSQDRPAPTPLRRVAGRTCLEVGGVWIDQDFDAQMTTVAVKAQGEAYFRLLERQPQLKEVFQLGNSLVWVTPSGAALVVDPDAGKEQLTDAEIDKLFVAEKK